MSSDSGSTFADISSEVGIFKSLFNAMPQLSWTATPDGAIDFFNEGWYQFTGTTYEEVKGWGWEIVHHPDHLQKSKESFVSAYGAGAPFELEFPMRRHDGVFEWFLTKVSPLKDSEGEILRWVGINTNIQALKENQILVEDRERRFVTMANALPNFVWSADLNLNVDFFNERWYQYTGLTVEESLGQGWRQAFSEDMLKKMNAEWDIAIRTKTPYSAEQQIRSRDGEYRWFLTKAYPLLGDDGEIVSWFGTNTDIDEQKKASEVLERKVLERTRELELEKDRAVSADAAKTSFVATIGHEIRSPLSGVIGLLEILTGSVKELESKELAQTAYSSSKRLLDILNDLLDVSKLQAGKLQIENIQFSLYDVIGEVALLLKTSAEKKGISLEFSLEPDLPTFVYGDELRLRQILVNLISNAIKFTESGFVHIKCKPVAGTENIVTVRFEVEDSGIGIPSDKLSLLFQPYTQLESSTSRKFGGTGLGLSICEQLASLMGGRIGVESEVNQGSQFWVEIPFPIESSSR
jgi:PAS domain S-box-containing protein